MIQIGVQYNLCKESKKIDDDWPGSIEASCFRSSSLVVRYPDKLRTDRLPLLKVEDFFMLFSVQVLPAHRDLANHHVARVDRVARHVDLEMHTMLRAAPT